MKTTDKMQKRGNAGITLIVLVLVIVGILILTTVTIGLLMRNKKMTGEEGTEIYNKSDSKEKEGLEIKSTTSDENWAGKVNTPQLSEGMIPVKWNGSKWEITTNSDKDWYSYNSKDRRWANVMLSDGKYNASTVVKGTKVEESELRKYVRVDTKI